MADSKVQAMSIIVILPIIASMSILACHVYSALGNVDAWPLSSYPMYSQNMRPESTVVYRAQLEYSGGACGWWEPTHYKDKEEFSIQFKRIALNSENASEFFPRASKVVTELIVHDLLSGGMIAAGYPCRIRVLRRTAEVGLRSLKVSETVVCQGRLPSFRQGHHFKEGGQ
jgi:hypothetical protein